MITEPGQQEEVSEEVEPESVRDHLEAAFAEAEEKDAAPVVEAAPVERPAAPEKAQTQVAPTEPAQTKPEGDQPAPTTEPEKPASIKTEKAPQSWTPAAREKWATLPGEVRAEVQRREREVAKALQETAEERKVASAYRQRVGPFEAMIRSEGVEPMAAVESLLQTAQALRTAPPPHRAAIVAQIIRNHGIDPAAVAQALQGQTPPTQSAADPNTIAAQVRQQVMREMEQRQMEGQRSAAEAQIHQFAAGQEFFEDVAPMLPGIIQGRKDAGLPTTLEQAYSLACQLHPEVSAVMKQRAAATQANASRASTQRARSAATSVKGGPAGVRVQAPQHETIRDALEAAWQE